MVAPTQPEFGVKLTPEQPLGPQPPALTGAGNIIIVSSDTKDIQRNSFIFRLYDFLN